MSYYNYHRKLEALVSMIEKNPRATMNEFAKRLQVSRSTVFRMLENAKALGNEINYDKKNKIFRTVLKK